MSLRADDNGTGGANKSEPMEAGTYKCRVVQVIDMGVQPQRAFQGNEKPPIRTIKLTYEFVDEFLTDENGNELEDKPRWLSEDLPLHPMRVENAGSTKRMKVFDPDNLTNGDWSTVLGAPCMVTITATPGKGNHAGKVFNNVSAVTTMRDKEAKALPDLVNPPKLFIEQEPDMEVFGSLPDWLQDKIKSNLNFKGSALEAAIEGKPTAAPATNDEGDDDVDW